VKFAQYIPVRLKGISPVIWEQSTKSAKRWKMLPEFNIDLIFNLEFRSWTIHTEAYRQQSYNPTDNFCFISGLHTKPHYVEFPFCHMFGIRLNTVAASLLFGIPCKEIKNWSLDGDWVFRDKYNYMLDNVCNKKDFTARALWLEDFIYRQISDTDELSLAMKISGVLDKICKAKTAGKEIRMEDLTGYSRMHTHRIFQKWFGLTFSEALSFRRFEHALDLIHHSNDSLTQIGLNCGFYDQAHFIKVFRRFAEMTPRQYMQQKTSLMGQLPL
jgi:AraC-like DNA-binding protein